MRIVVIDSSSESMLNIDYAAAKESGVHGVILHAGYGSDASQVDEAFRSAYEKAIAAGMYVGAYWMNYFRTVEDAVTEADVFHDAINGCDLQLGVYADYEEDTIDYMDRSSGSKADFTSRIIAFMDRMIELGHAKSRFYSNTNCFNGAHGAEGLDVGRLLPYGFWHAHYNGDEGTQETEFNGLTVVGHQFANNDNKPEWIQGCPNIDVSIFNLEDVEEIKQISTPQEAIPEAVEIVAPQEQCAPPETQQATEAYAPGENITVLNAEQYTGGSFTTYYDTYQIIECKGDRAVIGVDGKVTAAINISNIARADESQPIVEQSQPQQSFSVGATVRVVNAEQYTGGSFIVYFDSYTLMELNGDRAVIGVNDQVTAAINISNIDLA